jgi:hypothetical protein
MAAIVAGDILFKLSIKSGAAGNAAAQPDKNASLGKYISTTGISGALNDLFDDISGAENAASITDYRCLFIHNSNTANALQNAVVWMTEVAGGANVTIAVDSLGPFAITAGPSPQAAEIATEVAVPSGVGAFSAPSTQGAGLALGTIPANQCKAIWIKRSAAASSALSNDGVTINVAGDTGNL